MQISIRVEKRRFGHWRSNNYCHHLLPICTISYKIYYLKFEEINKTQ